MLFMLAAAFAAAAAAAPLIDGHNAAFSAAMSCCRMLPPQWRADMPDYTSFSRHFCRRGCHAMPSRRCHHGVAHLFATPP